MNIIGYTYEGGFHCPRHAALRFTPAQLAGEEIVYCKDGTAPTPVFDHDETPEGGWQCEEDLDEDIAARDAKPERTIKESADFIFDEVLDPFPESQLYEDYQDDYESRVDPNGENDHSEFTLRYDEGCEAIRIAVDSHAELKEALDNLLAYMDGYEHDWNKGEEIPQFAAARAALAKASR